jgi:hypothetical protein
MKCTTIGTGHFQVPCQMLEAHSTDDRWLITHRDYERYTVVHGIFGKINTPLTADNSR